MKLRIYRTGSDEPINYDGDSAEAVIKISIGESPHWMSLVCSNKTIHIRISEIAMIEEVP